MKQELRRLRRGGVVHLTLAGGTRFGRWRESSEVHPTFTINCLSVLVSVANSGPGSLETTCPYAREAEPVASIPPVYMTVHP